VTFDGELEEAFPPMSVTLTLEDEIDISRGDMIVHSNDTPTVSNRFDAMVVWMAEEELLPGRQYDVKLATQTIAGGISSIRHCVDVNTQEEHPAATLKLNEIARCEITLERPVVADDYRSHHGTGSFIIVDRLNNTTVAAGMIAETGDATASVTDSLVTSSSTISKADKERRFGQKATTLAITGGTEEQRDSLFTLEQQLFNQGRAVAVLNRNNLPGELKAVAELLNHNGLLVLAEATAELPADALLVNLDGGDADLSLNSEAQPVSAQVNAALELLRQHKLV
jgi:bifunctional enzyme CysN/CysC